MSAKVLPDSVKREIEVYLSPNEKISGTIFTSRRSDKNIQGDIWIIRTDNTILFHTREVSKEPVVALLPLNRIQVIDYFQKTSEIVLTFYPEKATQNSTIVSFPIEQKNELENFCEPLADLIYFKKETGEGIKVYDSGKDKRPEKSLKTSRKNEDTEERSDKAKPQISPTHAKSAAKEFSPPPNTNPTRVATEKSPIKKVTQPISASSNQKVKISRTPLKSTSAKSEAETDEIDLKFVLLASLVSFIVAFIWFKFFKLLSRKG